MELTFVIYLPMNLSESSLKSEVNEVGTEEEDKEEEDSKSLETMSSTVSSVKTPTDVLSNYKSPSLRSSLQSEEVAQATEDQLPTSSQEKEVPVLKQVMMSLKDMEIASIPSEDENIEEQEEEVSHNEENLDKEESSLSHYSVQFATSVKPKTPPQSVLDIDEPFHLPQLATVQIPFEEGYKVPPIPLPRTVLDDNQEMKTEQIPFEQGWRRNPIPLPQSVLNEDASDSDDEESEEVAGAVANQIAHEIANNDPMKSNSEPTEDAVANKGESPVVRPRISSYSESVDRAVERNITELMGGEEIQQVTQHVT